MRELHGAAELSRGCRLAAWDPEGLRGSHARRHWSAKIRAWLEFGCSI